jgi:hypothetical protein
MFSKSNKPAKRHPKVLQYEELEPRVLFSADYMPGLDDIAVDEQVVFQDIGGNFQVEREAAPETVEQTAAETRLELVIVNEDVADYKQLIDDLQASDDNRVIEVVVLESDRDGFDQVSEILAERSDVAAVHFITHGAEGQINLGNSRLTGTTLVENTDAVAGWGKALTQDADLLFYGCDLASNADGRDLVESLSTLTGADVAASIDDTGHAILGGDWELEYTKGSIETDAAFSAELQQNWSHLLNVAVDATSTGTSTGGDFSVSHTTSGSDRLMLVGVSINNLGSNSVNGITYNGDALTRVGWQQDVGVRVEIWALVNPTVGTHDVIIDIVGTSGGNTAGVMTFTGVDQTTPLGSFSSGAGWGSSGFANISSAADELVFAAIADRPRAGIYSVAARSTVAVAPRRAQLPYRWIGRGAAPPTSPRVVCRSRRPRTRHRSIRYRVIRPPRRTRAWSFRRQTETLSPSAMPMQAATTSRSRFLSTTAP